MQIIQGSIQDCKQIAKIYRSAFPESIDFFFNDKSESNLLELLEMSFKAIFFLGGQTLIVKCDKNEIIGYCFYLTTLNARQERDYGALISLLPKFVTKVKCKELSLLIRNKITMARPFKRKPKSSAQIVSIAIDPQEQGKGLGRILLESVLSQMENETVSLNVRANNESARHLYEKAGFKTYDHTTDLSGQWICMIKAP